MNILSYTEKWYAEEIVDNWSVFHEHVPDSGVWVYVYMANSYPVYVGSTLSPKKRAYWHFTDNLCWSAQVTHVIYHQSVTHRFRRVEYRAGKYLCSISGIPGGTLTSGVVKNVFTPDMFDDSYTYQFWSSLGGRELSRVRKSRESLEAAVTSFAGSAWASSFLARRADELARELTT